MYVERLSLCNFRLYVRRNFTFSTDFNVIEGANAQGKTAVLEALYLAAIGASFRTAHLSEILRHGGDLFSVDVSYCSCGIEQQIKIRGALTERQVYFNGARQSSLGALLGGMKVTAFTPEDSALVKGPPQLRRHYLDLQIGQVDPLYNHYLRRYTRAMKQRNCLLRAGSAATLDSWEYELAHAAAYLIMRREAAMQALGPRCERLYKHLSGRESSTLTLHYKCGGPQYIPGKTANEWQEHLCSWWRKNRHRDSMMGVTLAGPHKDEIYFLLDGLELRHYGSEGERRTCAAVLRLAEWEQVAAQSDEGNKPLLLVDDLSLGLDLQRQLHFLDYLNTAGQVFITTAQPLDLKGCGRSVNHLLLT